MCEWGQRSIFKNKSVPSISHLMIFSNLRGNAGAKVKKYTVWAHKGWCVSYWTRKCHMNPLMKNVVMFDDVFESAACLLLHCLSCIQQRWRWIKRSLTTNIPSSGPFSHIQPRLTFYTFVPFLKTVTALEQENSYNLFALFAIRESKRL